MLSMLNQRPSNRLLLALAAFVGAVVGEYLGSAKGVGYLILQAEGVFDINTVFAGVLVLTACALVLDRIVTLAERRLLRWRPGNVSAAS